MDWLKSHYEKVILAVSALGLIATGSMLFLKAQQFAVEIPKALSKNTQVEPVDTARLDAAALALVKPGQWVASGKGSFFVSEKYLVSDGKLVNPLEGGSILHPPVPNQWFLDHGLDLLNTTVLEDDPDKDGFTNYDEWVGSGTPEQPKSTDPNNPDSHPPYVSKLRLVELKKIPFRVILRSWEGNPAEPSSLQFQINTLDVRQPTQFVKIGEQIAGTPFKTVSFTEKKTVDSNEVEKDVSELVLEHVEGKGNLVLVVDQLANSPDSYAVFRNLWAKGEQDFAVKLEQNFRIKPETDREFKLISITDERAVIEDAKTAQKIDVPRLDAPGL